MRNDIDLSANFDEVAKFIGSAMGYAGEVETPYYINDLLKAIHATASAQFDKDTAVVAAATQRLGHMYEWGTIGINPATKTPRLKPTAKRAKLWKHTLTGGATSKKIGFLFKSSIVPVPLPTPRSSGISKGDLGKWPSRRHMFFSRPAITELGVTITIKPRYGQALFIPLNGRPVSRTSGSRTADRGYVFTVNPVQVTPGRQNAGQFTSHWLGWWSTVGRQIMNKTSSAIVDGDLHATIYTGKGGVPLKTYRAGAQTKAFNMQVDAARGAAKAIIKARRNKRELIAQDMEDNVALMGGKL